MSLGTIKRPVKAPFVTETLPLNITSFCTRYWHPRKTVAVDTLRYADEAVSVIDLNGCLTIETGIYAAITELVITSPLIRA